MSITPCCSSSACRSSTTTRAGSAAASSSAWQIAQAQQRAGHTEDARHNYELAKRAGQGVGPKNLDEPERQAYFATVKLLGEDAMSRGDVDSAIENFRLYSESERSGIETLRTLAELYERRGDPLAAARVTDQALQYNSKDRDLLDRKLRYYNSIEPDDLKRRQEHYGPGFDVAYCLEKARNVLAGQHADVEWLDVAYRLTELVLVVKPGCLAAKLILARLQLRLGERDKALALLEEIHGPQKPDKFASEEDEDAWNTSCRFLGDLYLEIGRPDLAVPCLNDFRKTSKSGAATWFKLGQAYEQLGNAAQAIKCYQQVTGYPENPLAPDAYDALSRLQA
jgi:tetratricopeptide (TPR) repeat protein